MATKQQIQNIKTDIERTIQGLRAKPQEFTYEEGGFVKPDTLYSVYYTLDKQEEYLTGIQNTTNSRRIFKETPDTLFGEYSSIDVIRRQDYPKESTFKPTEVDYKIGEVTRYFTQQSNDNTKPIFEIDKKTFDNKNNLYRYISFTWIISGLKQDVERENSITIRFLETELPGISRMLFPLQLWTPPKDSKEDLENKLSRLKK
jgi:hypothetical protein